MRLEGPVIMNGRQIGQWEARMIGPSIAESNLWECTVQIQGDTTRVVVEHTYSEGLAILIGKCLSTHTEIEARKAKLKQN